MRKVYNNYFLFFFLLVPFFQYNSLHPPETSYLQEVLADCCLLDCGRATAVEIGGQAGARIEVGKRLLWNVSKVKSYIDRLAEEQNKDE